MNCFLAIVSGRVGFENITYTVSEGVGSQQVCLRMFEPSDNTSITENFRVSMRISNSTRGERVYLNNYV